LIHLAGHTVGHLMWDKPEDAGIKETVSAMKSHEAAFMGATRSMADYYSGYSLIVIVLFVMTIAILWLGSGLFETARDAAKKLLLPVGIAYLAFGVIEFLHFFPFAAAMSFLAGLLTTLAVAVAKK
jgi:hypothetical protein